MAGWQGGSHHDSNMILQLYNQSGSKNTNANGLSRDQWSLTKVGECQESQP